MKNKVIVYTIKLTADEPIDTDMIEEALLKLGPSEVTNYVVKTVKA
jgi:hypothetical protein